ncbi:Os07g0580850 [Oryza sativa Japonica Group]|uniref:Os07g0580850 protein n=2 Tax=Oryza sativa subsp. japonica TaxID=39947 RepID=A3BLJ2_ORYSJ|nr:hypothetical protein OsJ_24884 [Oryza sativa Japonica Group]BAT02333.1 Os07g0580850 [Oryza sativa Japonica Group]
MATRAAQHRRSCLQPPGRLAASGTGVQQRGHRTASGTGTTAVVQLPGRRTTSSAADADAVQPQLTRRSLRAAPPPAAAAASPAASRLDLA